MTPRTTRLQLRRMLHGNREVMALFHGDRLVAGQVKVTIDSAADGVDTVTVRFYMDGRVASGVDNRLADKPMVGPPGDATLDQ